MAPRRADVLVCCAGTAGCVVAARLAEDPDLSVLVLEAGAFSDAEEVRDPRIWMRNIGSERDWRFVAEPSPGLGGRCAALPMGKVVGGGSSVNGLVWARGHKADFDLWEAETGDPGWGYEAALSLYRRIEDWSGPANPRYRGQGGPMRISLPADPVPVALALADVLPGFGIPKVADLNAEGMAMDAACGIANVTVDDDGRRVSTATAYLAPRLGQPNLTVLTGAEVRRLLVAATRVVGVEYAIDGRVETAYADETVLSLGAIATPKVLMLSGIGDSAELARHGIGVVQHLPGVGANFQDHILVAGCVFEYRTPEPPRNNSAEFTFFAMSRDGLGCPDLQPMLEETAFGSEITGPRHGLPSDPSRAFTLAPGLIRPESRGRVVLTGPRPEDPVRIEANFLSAEADVRALLTCLALCREIGNSDALRPFVRRELMPGPLGAAEMETFLREAAGTYFHETCTAKMGRDAMAVVDGSLKVYGVSGLRIADGSVMPAVAGGNTMAPCVLIGERAADLLKRDLGAAAEVPASQVRS